MVVHVEKGPQVLFHLRFGVLGLFFGRRCFPVALCFLSFRGGGVDRGHGLQPRQCRGVGDLFLEGSLLFRKLLKLGVEFPLGLVFAPLG